jgi:hypothetical protein
LLTLERRTKVRRYKNLAAFTANCSAGFRGVAKLLRINRAQSGLFIRKIGEHRV